MARHVLRLWVLLICGAGCTFLASCGLFDKDTDQGDPADYPHSRLNLRVQNEFETQRYVFIDGEYAALLGAGATKDFGTGVGSHEVMSSDHANGSGRQTLEDVHLDPGQFVVLKLQPR